MKRFLILILAAAVDLANVSFAQTPSQSFDLYRASLAAAEAALRTHDIRAAKSWLTQTPKAYRGWEWNYLMGQTDMSLHTFRAKSGAVTAVAFSPNDKVIAAGTKKGGIILWDVNTGDIVHMLQEDGASINDLKFDHSGDLLASASEDSTVRLWLSKTGTLRSKIVTGNHKPVRLAFAPEKERLAISMTKGIVVLWDLRSSAPVDSLTGNHPSWASVTGLSFVHGKRLLASAAWDGKINLWDPENGSYQRALGDTVDHGPDFGAFNDIAAAPNGKFIVGVTFRGGTHIWQTDDWGENQLKGHTKRVLAVDVNASGMIATGSRDQTIRLWDAAHSSATVLHGHVGSIFDLAFSNDGTRLVSGGDDGTVRLWDVETVQEGCVNHGDMVWGVGLNQDGSLLVSAGSDKHMRLWDLARKETLWDIEAHEDVIAAIKVSPDGRYILSGANSGPAKIWELNSGKLCLELEGHTRGIPGTAFSSNDLVATASYDGTVRVWSFSNGEELLSLKPEGVDTWAYGVIFWPDGNRIAGSWNDGTIAVWEVPSGKPVGRFNVEQGRIGALAIHPGGRWLAASNHDGFLYVWNVGSSELIHRSQPHDDLFYGLEFSPDGKRLVTCSYDRTVKLWDTDRWVDVLTIYGFPRELYSARFSQSGSKLAVGGLDGIVRILSSQFSDSDTR